MLKIGYLMQEGVPDIRQKNSSGPANHVIQIARELKLQGHQVRILAVMGQQIWKTDDLEIFTKISLPWLEKGPIRWVERILRRIQYTFRLPYAAFFDSIRFAQACRQELAGYDLFYERLGWMGYGGCLASQALKVPLILEVNGDHINELKISGKEPIGAQRRLSLYLMKRIARHADFTIATGEGWRQRHIEQWGIDPAKISVIENGTEVVDVLQRRQLHCFQDSEKIGEPTNLIYVGAFEPWSGLPKLMCAVEKVIRRGICVKLSLVGSGTIKDQLEEQIRGLKLTDYVTIMGYQPIAQVAKFLADSDIGLSPYCGRVEFSGLKLLDYKAAGLATIASGKNGQPAIIENGRTGIIVSPCSEDELMNAIVQLSTDINFRKQMGRNARIESENQHKWSQTAFELEKVFTRVVER